MTDKLRTVTPFRALPTEIQRTFKYKYPGVDGLYFNRMWSYYFDRPELALNHFFHRLRGTHVERETGARELIALFETVQKGMTKLTEHNSIIAESEGLCSVVQLREQFWYLDISEWGKKHLSINMWGGCDFEKKTHAEWKYRGTWENIPYAKMYKAEDVKAAADRLMDKLVADAEQRLADMKTLSLKIKEA